MISFTICITFLGFFVLYNTSKRAKLSSQLQLETWVQRHAQLSKKIGSGMLITGLVSGVLAFGFASGIFSYLVILMTIASLIVLVAPLRFLNYHIIILIGISSILLEIFIQ
ncbi:hypothetical protein [Membranihabitans maritimus]|uniref:hypothetical protein n=1 Tax=Membranihabitans maritimus TaxID=2904244 RepID=UPI001F177CD8|nr:hypothetical protein [Membranihabitans maritimus]